MLPNWLYGKSKSKLAELLGGGGTPADYNQVKTQVTQNTEDITLLNNAVNGKVGWDDYSELGAVNLAPNNMTNRTALGVTFTVDSNGAITASGTATNNIRIDIGKFTLKAGVKYKISDLANGQPSLTFGNSIYARRASDFTWIMDTYGSGGQPIELTPTQDVEILVGICINNGLSVDKTFYPMITVASYNGSYVPYSMTNRDLTDKLTADANLGTPVNLSSYTAYSNLYTAPSDGYVHFLSAASGSAARTIYTYGNNTTAATDPHFTHSTSANNKAFEIFIKKGLKVYADGLQSGDTINFYPLS